MVDQLARLSPGSADASALDNTAKPVGISNRFASSQDLAGLEQINASLQSPPFPPGQAQVDYHKPPENASILYEWYRRNDGPWTGLASSRVDARSPSAIGNLRANPHIFQYRENGVSSECSTTIFPSDSGYASFGAKHSVTNNSVCDESFDRNTETQSVIGHMNELHFQPFAQPQDILPRNGLDSHGNLWQLSQGAPKFNDQASQPSGHLMCSVCQKPLKTNSELRKHTQRHTKPHICDVPGCARREGFSTPNDLDRHKRSVHPETAAAGNRYVCPVPSCKTKGKKWPRADNFRAHLKRVHHNDVTDDQLEKYAISNPPAVIYDLAREDTNTNFSHSPPFPLGTNNAPVNYWSLPQSEIIEISNEPSPIEDPSGNTKTNDTLGLENISRNVPHLPKSDSGVSSPARHQTDISLDLVKETPEETPDRDLQSNDQAELPQRGALNQGSILLSHAGSLQSKDEERAVSPPICEIEDGSSGCRNEVDDSSMDVDSPGSLKEVKPVEFDNCDSQEPNSQQDAKPGLHSVDLNDQKDVARLLETLQNNGLLEQFGYKKEPPVEPDTKGEAVTAAGSSQEGVHPCSKCKKKFGRRCELRKHEKRHAKPYCCTYPSCNKKFGSKNDWKRHENSQHFQMEVWKCDVQLCDLPSELCGKVLNRRESFKQHLQTNHGMDDQDVLEKRADSCHIGRHYQSRFWCGFCQTLIESKQKGLRAWNERFDHIDNHFVGKNNFALKDIRDWKNLDPDLPAKDMSAPDSDDSDRSPSPEPLLNDSNKPDVEYFDKSGKQPAAQIPKSRRRKKAADNDGRILKRRRAVPIDYCCCQCGEIMPKTSRLCTNFPCDHKLCNQCTSAKFC